MLVKPSPGFSNIMLRQKVYDSNIYSNRPLRIQNPSPDADWKIRRISLFFQLTKLFSVQSRQAKNAKKTHSLHKLIAILTAFSAQQYGYVQF